MCLEQGKCVIQVSPKKFNIFNIFNSSSVLSIFWKQGRKSLTFPLF